MKENSIHICFVVDESGSMYSSQSDVIGGFRKVIDEQRAVKDGSCIVSLFKFENRVTEVYRGKEVKDVPYLDEKSYCPGGGTAMNDAIGTAIDSTVKWVKGLKESEQPEKHLFVIMTDGMENSSREYNGHQIREMIKKHEDEDHWTFMYLGADITDAEAAVDLGINYRGFADRGDLQNVYCCVSSLATEFRNTSGSTEAKYATFTNSLDTELSAMNTHYEKKLGRKIANNDKKA